MSVETATIIQTAAAIIQATAAAVFLCTVLWDARERRNERQRRARLAEQERKDRLVSVLRRLWVQSTVYTVSKTDEELAGFDTPRIIGSILLSEWNEARPINLKIVKSGGGPLVAGGPDFMAGDKPQR